MVKNRKAIHFLKTNPKGWMSASLPKFMATAQEVMAQAPLTKMELEDIPWSQRHDYLNSYALKRQEKRWEDEVGIKPEESHFSLIVPIHNEEYSLPSFLRTLILLDIPSSVDMKVIFITNACNDSSSAFIDEFLSTLGKIEDKSLDIEFRNQIRHINYKATMNGGITFMHVDTQTPGKANALGIGNSIALKSGYAIAMSVDANNYLEPDAIRIMFSHAHRSFRGKPRANDTVLLSGRGKTETKVSKLKNLIDKASSMQLHLIEVGSGLVNGWVMAWNIEWMHSIGGPPEVALEDYAMGVLARVKKYKIEQVKEASIWGYGVNSLKGLLNTRARYVRGKLQLLDLVHHDPSVVSIIENEAFYMKNFPGRLQCLLQKFKRGPLNLPRYVAAFLLWEYALRRGKQDYKQNPTNQSWEKIDSTF